VLRMLPATSFGKLVRGSIFTQAVVSMAATMVLSAAPTPDGPPSPPPGASHTQQAPPASRTAHSTRDSVATQERIEHCQSRGPEVWLTFDDGGSARQVRRILAVLRHEHVQAIFFPIGSWAEANPALVRRIGREGHLIGDHTHDHVDLAKLSGARASWQIRHGESTVRGEVPLLRPPFGAGAYTARLDDLASAAGLRLCTWTVDTRDWTGSSAATIIRRVRHGDRMTPPVTRGGVVIMHMNGDHTGQALPGVIHAVRARGLSLHRLPD
jgi:peptidoglycan/xylan/chitin deacetylase (PgdA/CDA1 family)